MISPNVYITTRVSDTPEQDAAPQSRCSRCKAPVWIDPMTYVPAASRHEKRSLRVLCGPCAEAEGLLR